MITLPRLLLFFMVIVLIHSCSLPGRQPGELILKDPDPQKDFRFPYFLFIPDQLDVQDEIYIIVEPNNSGFTSDNIDKHLEKAERTASNSYYIGNYLSVKLNYPLLVPVFPRPDSSMMIYTHALDRDVVLQKGNDLERIDLQLLSMISDAEQFLKARGYTVNPKILMTGFSASGTFANRFSLIHPEKIKAYAAGGVNGLLMLPVSELENEKLIYPVGVYDFQELFDKQFDPESFRNIPQYLFMGENDENDAIPYDDGYDPPERELVYKLLGEKMQPDRWNRCIELYKKYEIHAEFETYEGLAHEHPETVKKDILTFFRTHTDQQEQ